MNAQTQSNGNNLVVQGRIVWSVGSSLFEGKKKTDYNTGAPIVNENGESVIEYGFGLAIAKIDPRTGQQSAEFLKVWQALHTEAFTLFPSGQIPRDFAMKFKDGDSIDDKGRPFADREGHAGHIVLACTTRIPIKYFKFEGGNNILVNTGIKNGDYVNVQINIKAHPAKGRGKAGLYLNPSAVQLIQSGKEIINTPSGDQVFGMQAPSYSGEVIAPVYTAMPQTAPMGAPAMPQGYPAHHAVLPQTFQPQTAPMGAPAMPQGYHAPQTAPMGAPAMPQGYPAPQTAPMGAPAMPQGYPSQY